MRSISGSCGAVPASRFLSERRDNSGVEQRGEPWRPSSDWSVPVALAAGGRLHPLCEKGCASVSPSIGGLANTSSFGLQSFRRAVRFAPTLMWWFDLTVRLGLGNRFWQGNVEAGLAHHLAPSGLTPTMLRNAPRGSVRVHLETRYRKYEQQGFSTPSGKLEIFSTALQSIGQLNPISQFPFVLTSAKTPIYCHSQHRNLSRLRRVIPEPVVEMNPATAELHEVEQGEWVLIATPRGRIRARAHLNASLADGVIGGPR